MFRIGLSSCGKDFGEPLFRQYAAAGIGFMEISMDKEDCDVFDFTEARRLSELTGVALWSFHLPFMPFEEIDISHPALARATVPYLCEMIRKGGQIGIAKFIVHPSGEPIAEEDRALRMETAKESLVKLADVAAENGAVMAVENLPRTCLGRDSGDILRLLGADDRLRVCFDTNHLLRETHADFIKAAGEKIVTTHVSDYDFIDEKHWLPGEGKVDWPVLATLLKNAGYGGVWLYELGFKAPRSHPRSRDLTCADFVRNAREIFSGGPITAVE